MNVQLIVEQIECNKTTEHGHDEVYLLLGGASYDANNAPTPISKRAPDRSQLADADEKSGEFTAWDCNDSGEMQKKNLNTNVFTVDVPEAGHVVLSLLAMESDGTSLGDQIGSSVELGSKIVGEIPEWGPVAASIAGTVAGALKTLIPRNQDDHLGTVSYTFSNQSGKVLVTDSVYGSNTQKLDESGVGIEPYTNSVRFFGDGAEYKIKFRIDHAEKGVLRYRGRLKLKHAATGCVLHSHPFNYSHPRSSLQQQVTCFSARDKNDWWIVKGPGNQEVRDGQPVRHFDVIRLEHVETKTNLHSHPGIPSPVTGQQEVTCFGRNGVGDGNDNWRVEVDGGGLWGAGKRARLIHVNTNFALHSHPGQSNPTWTRGQQEVTAFQGRDDNDWRVLEEM